MGEKEIDEIFSHIQKIKKIGDTMSSQDNSNEKENDSKKHLELNHENHMIIRENTNNSVEVNDEDVINAISHIRNSEPITIMKPEVVGWTDESKVICDLCDEEMVLGKNLSGLVVSDEWFACEGCCQRLPKEDLLEWTRSKMTSKSDVRPIGLWVIQQQ